MSRVFQWCHPAFLRGHFAHLFCRSLLASEQLRLEHLFVDFEFAIGFWFVVCLGLSRYTWNPYMSPHQTEFLAEFLYQFWVDVPFRDYIFCLKWVNHIVNLCLSTQWTGVWVDVFQFSGRWSCHQSSTKLLSFWLLGTSNIVDEFFQCTHLCYPHICVIPSQGWSWKSDADWDDTELADKRSYVRNR